MVDVAAVRLSVGDGACRPPRGQLTTPAPFEGGAAAPESSLRRTRQLQMTIAFFICHLCHFFAFSSVLTPDSPPSRPPSLPLSLDGAAEAARLAVAGQTEPSQVFL
ncbi:unnamed protein product [Tetraodon nigroviridis]|uniref:(spotted green pufferfish) hypothetical protein n=1 Tax=Tetraodon nigroviridis TaxID=99883 RepID=Q4RR63_TETNG|nr:unnamed protein product [Tetraodon nigroviridis]